MILRVYSLQKQVLREEAASVNLQTTEGEITVLDHHRPLIAPLKKGKIRITDRKGVSSILEAEGGFIEVRPQSEVNILID